MVCFVLLILIFIGVIAWGSFDIRLNYFLKSFNKNFEIKEKKIALTFDDGPTELTPKFLELLKQNNTKATFFCIGKQIEKHPEIFKQIIENGHEIGNHTFSHDNKTGFLSTKKMMEEIVKCDKTIENFGISTSLYRPPFGVSNPNIAKAISNLNKKSIGWNIRSLDTILKDPEKIFKRIQKKIKPGSIILLHDTSEKSAEVLEKLLLFLEQNQYETVTVSELIKFKNS